MDGYQHGWGAANLATGDLERNVATESCEHITNIVHAQIVPRGILSSKRSAFLEVRCIPLQCSKTFKESVK